MSSEELYTKEQVDEISFARAYHTFYTALNPISVKSMKSHGLDVKVLLEGLDKTIDLMKKYPSLFGEDKINELTNKKNEIIKSYT